MVDRVFVAVAVEPAVRAALDARLAPARTRHPDVAWTRPSGWHVTLAFCGRVSPEQRLAAAEVVDAAAMTTEPPRLGARAVASWGGRTLVVALADESANRLADLGADLQRRLVAAGVPVDERPVTPHLTIARARRSVAAWTRAVEDVAATLDPRHLPRWRPDRLGLWRADHGSGPAHYRIVHEGEFGAG